MTTNDVNSSGGRLELDAAKYPEHAKMAQRKEELDHISAFFRWLARDDSYACQLHSRYDNCVVDVDRVLAHYVGASLQKLQAEHEAMIEELIARSVLKSKEET